MLQEQMKAHAQIDAMLCAEGKSLADFSQMKQLQENNEEHDYVTIEEAIEVATLLPAGKTVHKTFGLPVPLFADSSSSIKIQSKEAQYLKKINIFIWDEAPMAPRYALEIMDRTLRDIMNNNLPFDGKIIVLGGDFRQLLPIKIHGTRCEIVNLSIKFSPNWKHFISFSLTENMRVLPEETEFAKFILDLGDGILNDSNDNIQLPDYCIAPISADIVEDIYGDLIQNKEFNKMAKCAILSARNADVEEINKRVVELLDISEERIYTSTDSTENCGDNCDINEVLLPEYLNTLSPSSLPSYELRLRPNCIIMLIRNLSINEGLCNGTRLMIIELADHLLKCKILTGDKVGDIVFLNPGILDLLEHQKII
ncbi:ATP-dependent DNA helicase PIF1-like [Formica exsecta]|uniref:ATP-dependent DNA helicase PIF1-like n=1 Tax=Formica exsecta TaxID=72781 RepID=UPI001142BC94|nr:ATP-dependent DNA helicase PIF1-like [Formica exsecta]